MKNEKPMMVQYRRFKEEYPGGALLFRLGGFYELFNEDAYIASKELGLTVTVRNAGDNVLIPQCGVPVKAAEKHARALSEKGYTVVICDQADGESEEGVRKRIVSDVVRPPQDAPPVPDFDGDAYAAYLVDFEREAREAAELRKANPPKRKPTPVSSSEQELLTDLKEVDLNVVTPAAAWALLYKWKQRYGGDGL
jgi:DNA mismatch repair ATPase MutS